MQHEVAPRQRALWIEQRRIFRTVDHPGEQGRFAECQIRDRLAEIKLRGRGKSVIAVRQVDLVRVHGENLRLAVAPFDLQRQKGFFRFAAKADVAAVQKEIARELHGDGAGAAGAAATGDVAQGGCEHAREVDAPMLLEMLVFDGRDRVVEDSGTLLVGHQDATLQCEAAHQLAIVGVNFRDHVRAIGFEGANLGQVASVHKKQSAGGAEQNGAEQKKS